MGTHIWNHAVEDHEQHRHGIFSQIFFEQGFDLGNERLGSGFSEVGKEEPRRLLIETQQPSSVGHKTAVGDERRKDRERKRDNAERCRRYNEMHREERAAYARRRRQENPGLVAADNAYYKKKRRLAEKEAR